MKILNPVMYSSSDPVTIEDQGKRYKCQMGAVFGDNFGELNGVRGARGVKTFFCKIEYFDDHQVLHEITGEDEMEKCMKDYEEYANSIF